MGNAKLNKMRSELNSPIAEEAFSALSDFNGILAMGNSNNPLVKAGGAKVMSNMTFANTNIGASTLGGIMKTAGIVSSDGMPYEVDELKGMVSLGLAGNQNTGYTALSKDSSRGDKSTINKDNNRITGTDIKDGSGNSYSFADFNVSSFGNITGGSANMDPMFRMSQIATMHNGGKGVNEGTYSPGANRFITSRGEQGHSENIHLDNVTLNEGVNVNGSLTRMVIQQTAGYDAAEFAAQGDNVTMGVSKYLSLGNIMKNFSKSSGKKDYDPSFLENLNKLDPYK